jgi:signal transduction histidine kinase
LKRRILVATLSVTVATLVVFGAPLAWALGRFYRGEQLSRLQEAATIAAATVPVEGLHAGDPVELPSVPAGVHLAYYDDRGALAAGVGPPRVDGLALGVLSGHPALGSSGGRLISAQPITANENTIGTVEAYSSLSALEWRSRRAWLSMLVLGAAAMAAAALIALWQARRLARPVDDLIAVADRLGDGDFTVVAPHSGVAEVDRASHALVSTAGRLRNVVERERAFTANASHQLRTPLTALRLSLDNALLTPGVDVEEAVQQAVTEVDRLQDTLEQLFLLARSGGAAAGRGGGDGAVGAAGSDGGGGGAGGAASGGAEGGGAGEPAQALARRSVPVADILGDLERRWHPTLAARGRRFEVRIDGPVAQRRAPATLGQILDILVDNAATHGRGTVEIAARAVSGGISIGVHDEGDGVAATGPPLASAGNGRPSEDGHGLGLGLAQSLVEAAGGRLVLRASPSDRGPVVAVILP